MIYCTSCQRETPDERLPKTAANLENDTEKRENKALILGAARPEGGARGINGTVRFEELNAVNGEGKRRLWRAEASRLPGTEKD